MPEYSIFKFQKKILQSDKPYIVAICGRSAGKSQAGAYWAFKKAAEVEGMGLIVAPVYQQAEIPIKYLIAMCEQLKIPYAFNKIPNFIKSNLPSHSNVFSMLLNGKLKQIKMASADSEDNLRSGSYTWALVDEACYISEEAWQILIPTLRGNGTNFNYQVLLISSPAGKNWLYEVFLKEPSERFELIKAPSWENTIQIDKNKLSIWEETMSKRMYLQEICAEILDSNLNAIFYAYNKDSIQPQKLEGSRIIVSLDQNVGIGAGVIIQRRDKKFHIINEVFVDDGATFESYVNDIHKKIPLNSTIDLAGDSFGNNRSVASLTTFYDSVISGLKKLGHVVYNKTNRSNPPVYDSREEVNRLFERKLLEVDPKCEHLIADFELATWKEKGIFETNKTTHDPHHAESLVYALWEFRQSVGLRVANSLL
jgi:hypothetical protein